MRLYQELVKELPEDAGLRLNLALALLGRGDFAEGLEAYEARRAKEDWIAMATRASMQAQWERRLKPGEDVAGKSVLVLTETRSRLAMARNAMAMISVTDSMISVMTSAIARCARDEAAAGRWRPENKVPTSDFWPLASGF